MTALPQGFLASVANAGIKDTSNDFVVVASDRPCAAAGVFTRSRFSGPSVTISRDHVADGSARALVVISKNANVANGPAGDADAREVVDGVARVLGVDPSEVLLASTGVIGRRYPMANVRAHLASLRWPFTGCDADVVATGFMTTDTYPKVATASAGSATVVGIAKGVGMIEPDMATLITAVFTDADIDAAALDAMWRRVTDRSFNSLSVDTDTSTSDTAVVLANGAAGAVPLVDLEAAFGEVTLALTRLLARDGEGATKLLVVTVDGARDDAQAKRVAKAVVNSPLVKTAVHGADPNWGRVAMAVGKGHDETDIDPDRVVIRFGRQEVYPAPVDDDGLAELAAYMKGDEVLIHVSLGIAGGAWTVYGCDLSDGYVRINADYTT